MHTPLSHDAGLALRSVKFSGKHAGRRTPVALRREAAGLNGFSFQAAAELVARVRHRIDQAESENWMARLWQRDATLWTGTDEDRWLGWLQPGMAPRALGRMTAICRRLCVAGFSDAVLLGMGGASLGAEALARTLGVASGGLRLHVLDSTDVAQVRAVQSAVDITRCLFVVCSKSGSTLESRMLAAYFHEQVARRLGRQEAGQRFVAITDPGSPMLDRARADGYAAVFEGEPSVGGRYSVLSPFGLVALALLGHDPAAFLRSARPMVRACAAQAQASANPGLLLGALLGEAALDGRNKSPSWPRPGWNTWGVGSSNCWPNPPARMGGASSLSPTSRPGMRAIMAATACSSTLRTAIRLARTWTRVCGGWRLWDSRWCVASCRQPSRWARSSFVGKWPPPWPPPCCASTRSISRTSKPARRARRRWRRVTKPASGEPILCPG
ncbi:hypothetical protein [Achromobacter sp. GD03932]|uniref:hypothetical protein n=1 Tax=Achromobacter sp. GD03932 TaxID=2975407 RepID=UPI00244A30D6|nr:hypothetical protein [Achromobacter sp. GD03932]MDH1300422.1 hypothetical protein [Achromobacter sp. GD03932]